MRLPCRQTKWQNRAVKTRAAIVTLLVAAVLAAALFEVDFRFDVALPAEVRVADPAAEAEFEACYRARDDALHATAFATIDNPDVQKEFIAAGRAAATRDCRALHPLQMITVGTPLRLDILDVEPRFW